MVQFSKYEELPEEVQVLVDRYHMEDADDAIQQIRELGFVVETNGFDEILMIGQNETAEEIFAGLQYDTQFVNSNWWIKVTGQHGERRLNTLVGVSGLINLFGVGLVNRLIYRAENGKGDKTVCRLRRGLKVTFYNR